MTGLKYSGVDILKTLATAKKYNKFLEESIIRYSTSRVMVDFGAGSGTFARALTASGYRIICVEHDPDLLEQLRRSVPTSYRELEEIPAGSAGYIYSLNVLEHIEDDLEALRLLHSKLKPGGRLFLYVPAFKVLYSSMDRKVGHFRRYGKNQMLSLLSSAGFTVEKARYADSLGFFVSLLFRFVGNKEGSLNVGMVKTYDSFIFPMSRLLDYILGPLIGKNLMVVARKPSE